MSSTRTPTDEELALAEGLFGAVHLFKGVAMRASHACDVGSLERAGMLFRLKAGPVRAGLLAQRARLSPSAITEIVEGLEAEGMVRREADPEDRRAVRVALTPDGRRHLQRFEHAAAIALAERLSGLTVAQRQRIRAAFADLRDVLGTTDFTSSSQHDSTLRQTTRGHKEAIHAR
jgi:DNA-binding MarR family transcriptional regulator